MSAQQLFLFDLHVLNAGQRARQRPATRFGWLTLPLPRCHLKTNDNNAKFEIHTPFFVLVLPSEKISVKTILKVDLVDMIGPENVLFAGMCVAFSTQELYGLRQ